jgi:hypothetical protein
MAQIDDLHVGSEERHAVLSYDSFPVEGAASTGVAKPKMTSIGHTLIEEPAREWPSGTFLALTHLCHVLRSTGSKPGRPVFGCRQMSLILTKEPAG